MLKIKRLPIIIPLFIMLLAACRAPLPAVSSSDTGTEMVVPAQATRTPTPARTPTPTPPKLTREQTEPSWEQLQKMEEGLHKAYKPPEKLFDSEVSYSVSGPTTKGMTITIANKKIKLPDDAYIKHYATEGIVSPGKTGPETPLYVIARGNSIIVIPKGSGKIYSETIAPGEEGAFNFLKEALK